MATIYVSKDAQSNLNPKQDKDSYLTQPELADAAVKWCLSRGSYPDQFMRVLDPGAGGGIWGEAARYNLNALVKKRTTIDGVELRRNKNPGYYDHWFPRQDFLKWETKNKYDLVIGNPPFKLAEGFIRKSMDLLMSTGKICFLLPVDFAHGQARSRGLFKEFPPSRIASLAERPAFRGSMGQSLGNANPNNYILVVWLKSGSQETLWESLSWKNTK